MVILQIFYIFARKYLEDGRLVISKGNRRFNALGQSL